MTRCYATQKTSTCESLPFRQAKPYSIRTSQDAQGDGFPLRVSLGATCGKPTDLLVGQIRAVARQRFMGTQPIATLSRNQLKRVEEALRILQGA